MNEDKRRRELINWLDGIILAKNYLHNTAMLNDDIEAFVISFAEVEILNGIEEIALILEEELITENERSYSANYKCYLKYFIYKGYKVYQRFEERC